VQKKRASFFAAVAAIAGIATIVSVGVLGSCSRRSSDYLFDDLDDSRSEQQKLIALLERGNVDDETRFALTTTIAENLLAEKKTANLVLFLTSAVEKNPDDPYNAYWLLMVAHAYLDEGAPSIAEYYFARILKNCPDLEIKGKSIHLVCLENLIKIADSPELQIGYYSDLITRFAGEIDLGYSYFMLARSYEQLGEWELAIQTYTQFLGYGQYDILIPGVPDAYEYAKRLVDYNTSSKDWTFETLDGLVTSVKRAIDTYDYRSLDKYRAKVNFFAMSWKQEASDSNSQADFRMSDFMGGNRIRYNDTLDASSSPNEAYLRTSGWNQYVSVWYLYFRKVDFPADPEIHGCWEWAGIYYGEKV
jgi:tetratricopeptide (TPR) repeat protein